MSRNLYIYILLIFILQVPLLANNKQLVLTQESRYFVLGKYLEILKDPQNRYGIQDVSSQDFEHKFIKSTSNIPSFGFTDDFIWIKFTINTKNIYEKNWILEFGDPLTDKVDFYFPDDKNMYNKISRGYSRPFSQRGNHYYNFIFNLNLKSNTSQTFYLNLKSNDSLEIPVTLSTHDEYERRTSNQLYLYGFYFGLISVIIILNLILFFSVKDLSYLNYVFFAFNIGLYLFAQSGLFNKYIFPEVLIVFNHYNLIIIQMMHFFGIQFTQYFFNTRKELPKFNSFLTIQKYGYLIFLFLPLLITYPKASIISYIFATPPMIVLIIVGVLMIKRNYAPAKYFTCGWGILIFFSTIYLFKNLGIVPSNWITNNSLYFGSSFELIILTIGLGERINVMKIDKEKAQKEIVDNLKESNEMIQNVNKLISYSEQRYKMLVEGSDDIIFSLDENWNFLTANSSVKDHFNVAPDYFYSLKFQDVLEDFSLNDKSKNFLQEKLDQFIKTKEKIQFHAEFKTSIEGEPKQMLVQLEYIEKDNTYEILGKASLSSEDTFSQNIEYQNQIVVISNSLTYANDVSYRLTNVLKKHFDDQNVNLLRIALREIIINSIEHGNLNISFEEKTRAIMESSYFAFVRSRQNNNKYKDKKVKIENILDSEKMKFIITDEGEGFDFKKIIKKINQSLDEEMIFHGRGIAMTMNIFDELQYNDKGNQATLIKYFNR